MTAPVQQNVIRRESTGQAIQKSFQPLIQVLQFNKQLKLQREDLALRREKFDLEKTESKKRGELTDAQIAQAKVNTQREEQALELNEQKLEGFQQGQTALSEVATEAATLDIEFGTPEWRDLMRQARASLDNPFAQEHLDNFEDQQR